MRHLLSAAAAAALIASFTQAVPVFADKPSGGWSDAGKLSTERPGSLVGILLGDGRVLVAGQSGTDYSGIGSIDIYDPTRGWSIGPRLQGGDPLGAGAAPLPNGGALVAGGIPWMGGFDGPGPGPTAAAFVYDAASATWIKAPNMSSPRSGATATSLGDGRVLVVGGYDRRVIQLPNPNGQPICCIQIQILPQASSEFFDPKSRSWSAGPAMGHGRFGQSAVALKSGQVLIVGGSDQQNPDHLLSSAELFDPTQDRWLGAGDIGAARKGFTLTALGDGRALLAGGFTADGSKVLRSTMLYDPSKRDWSPGPDMNDARANHAAAGLKDGGALIAGGVDQLGRLASSEVFDTSSGGWAAAGALTTARSDEAAITLRDGKVLVVGGVGSRGALASSELFDPNAHAVAPQPRTVAGPGRWLNKSSEPLVTYAQRLRVLKDGRVLVLPDANYGDFTAQIYDPQTDTWSTAISRKSDRTFAAGVALDDNNILLLMLDSEGQSPAKAEIVNLANGASRPVASAGHQGTARLDVLADGRVWLTGGPFGDKHTYFYDWVADRWSTGPDVPSDLYLGSVTPIPGGRLLVGGILKAMIFDPATHAWTDAGSFSTRWQSYSTTVLPSGDVIFAGGTVDQAQPDGRILPVATPTVMRWNHVTGFFARAKDMPAVHPFHSTVVLADGRVLFAGGIAGDPQSDAVSSVELYDPSKDSWSAAASMPSARSQASAVLLKDGTALFIGGYGILNPPPTLLYSPSAKPVRATMVGVQPWISAAIDVVLFIGAIGFSILLLMTAQRRRRHG